MRLFFVLILVVACSLPNKSTHKETHHQDIQAWLSKKYEFYAGSSPFFLSVLGLKFRYSEMDEFTEAHEDRILQWFGKSVTEMKSLFDYKSLVQQDKDSYDVWLNIYQELEEQKKYRKFIYSFNESKGHEAFLSNFVINFHTVNSLEDIEAYISRISALAKSQKNLLERARVASQQNIRPPRFSIQTMLAYTQKSLKGRPFQKTTLTTPLWADFETKLKRLEDTKKINSDKSRELTARAKMAMINDFKPSYEAMRDFFQSELKKSSTTPKHFSDPDYSSYYQSQLKKHTTLSLTPQKAYQIGLKQVKLIKKEMKSKLQMMDENRSEVLFYESIQKDPKSYFSNDENGRSLYLNNIERAHACVRKKLPEFFGTIPQMPLQIRRVESFREKAGGPQFYIPGLPDGTRVSTHYVHLSDMSLLPRFELEASAFHEGLPGHHLQTAIGVESISLPHFRKHAFFVGFIEGWGHYAESLADEMGCYQEEHSQFGRLKHELRRAARIVIDVGLHSLGWSEEQAIKYMKEVAFMPETVARNDVHRSLMMPGMIPSYMLGKLKIVQLKNLMKAELKEKYHPRDFHDLILEGAALPLDILERKVKLYISQNK